MVSKDRIKLIGDWSAWGDTVRQGRMTRTDDEALWVLLRSFPDRVVEDEAMAELRKQGRLLAKLEHPSILQLLHITRMAGSPVWVHEGFQGVSLARILSVLSAENQFLPVRVACEMAREVTQGIVAAFSQGFQEEGPIVVHPGADPSEVLIDAIGNTKVAGFAVVGEGQGIPVGPRGYVPANPGSTEQSAAYGVGALLVHAISGERPGPSHADENKQDAMLRRAVIRVLARPGEAMPDGLMDLIRACLSHAPDTRPALTELLDELERISAGQSPQGLRAWAPTTVPGLLQQQESGYPDADQARQRRHVDDERTATGEPSFEAPPVRSPAPREIATILAKMPDLEEEIREVTPLVSSGTNSIPTSETDVRLFQAEAAVPAGGGEAEVPVVTLELPPMEDTGEHTERGPTEGDVVGWPLAMGALVGMVVAAAVGWVVVEHMVDQTDPPDVQQTQAVSAPVPAPAPTVPVEAAEDALIAPDVRSEESVDVVEPVPESTASEPADLPPPPAQAPASSAPVESAPVPVSAPNPPPEEAPASKAPFVPPPKSPEPPARFPVSFHAADFSVDLMVVKCHQGSGKGKRDVFIADAGRGPCRVIGFRGEEQLVVSVVLHGPQEFRCFTGGERTCR